MPRRRAGSNRQKRRGSRPRREWVGGRLSPLLFPDESDEPGRADLAIWVEQPSGLIIGQALVDPEEAEGAVGRLLETAMERPLAGPPRRPDTIRVADPALVAELRSVLGGVVPVAVAPTPELESLHESLTEFLRETDEDASDLEEGCIDPDEVADLFDAARALYRAAPWEVADEEQALRMDIPALDIEGACVAIIGKRAERRGVLILPVGIDDELLEDARGASVEGPEGSLEAGGDWLALHFGPATELSDAMRHEAGSHGWPVAAADAYPLLERRDRDGAAGSLEPRDLRIATACAGSLAAFVARHRDLFGREEIAPVSEVYTDDEGLEVRFTAPYEAFPFLDADADPEHTLDAHWEPEPSPPAPRSAPRAGRNEPCPCGSGRKYKKCCLRRDEERPVPPGAHVAHVLDGRILRALGEFATRTFGFEWRLFEDDFVDPREAVQLAVPWSVYGYEVRGETVATWYLEEAGRHLSREERAWLDAQRAAWLSVWEVVAVEPGKGLTLRDLLSDETRQVEEVSGSETLLLRDALLARVVDYGGVSLVCGAHPRPLPPLDAADLVRRARGRLGRKRAVPVERVRDPDFGRYLIRRWEKEVADLDLRRTIPPEIHNTDGDSLLLTTDHFGIAPGARADVAARLAALEGVEPPEPDGEPPGYVFLRPGNALHASWDNTVIGRAWLEGETLRVETNSMERADALRERIEAACGERIRHRLREHADPLSEARRAKGAPAREPEPLPPSPELERLTLEIKQRHYADWPDRRLPALSGQTPREACRTADGRRAVDALLKDMENTEQRGSPEAPFEFSGLRRRLGLE